MPASLEAGIQGVGVGTGLIGLFFGVKRIWSLETESSFDLLVFDSVELFRWLVEDALVVGSIHAESLVLGKGVQILRGTIVARVGKNLLAIRHGH